MGLIQKGVNTWQSPGVICGFKWLNHGCPRSFAHHSLHF